MDISEAMDIIRENLIEQRLSGRETLWSTILKQIARRDSFDGQYADLILDAIRSFLKPLDDQTVISLWRETETRMCDDTDDECLFPESCLMDLEMELLEGITSLAWAEAKEPG